MQRVKGRPADESGRLLRIYLKKESAHVHLIDT